MWIRWKLNLIEALMVSLNYSCENKDLFNVDEHGRKYVCVAVEKQQKM